MDPPFFSYPQLQNPNASHGVSPLPHGIGVGEQSFKVAREGKIVDSLCGTSLMNITDICPYGIYNFNAYAGTLPAEASVDGL